MKERKIMEKKEGGKENILSFLCRVFGLADLRSPGPSVSRTFADLRSPGPSVNWADPPTPCMVN